LTDKEIIAYARALVASADAVTKQLGGARPDQAVTQAQ
jgi:hypothetical protein